MRRGPKPKPTALKLLSGARPSRVNDAEPTPAPGLPEAPAHLDAGALAEWNRMGPILAEMGCLTPADGPAFAMYCQTFSRWAAAEAAIAAEGLTLPTDRGGRTTNPSVRIARDCMAEAKRILAEFGATPAARSRLSVAPVDGPKDDLALFLAEEA